MDNLPNTKSRRDFLKDGMRAALLGGFAFMGIFLGWRGYSNPKEGSPCLVDLPCRSCSKLTDCREPSALETKLKQQDPRNNSTDKNKVA
jgi:hypothetical protein